MSPNELIEAIEKYERKIQELHDRRRAEIDRDRADFEFNRDVKHWRDQLIKKLSQ